MGQVLDLGGQARNRLENRRPILGFLAAWSFLNGFINIDYPFEGTEFAKLLLISPEILFILAIMWVPAALRMPFYSALFIPLTLAIIFFRLFRTADILIPMYLNRAFNLYLDPQFLPDLIFLLYSTLPLRIFIFYSLAAVTLIGCFAYGIWRSLKTIHSFLFVPKQRRTFSVAAVILCALLLSLNPWKTGEPRFIFAQGFFHRIVQEVDFILRVNDMHGRHLVFIRQAVEKGTQTPSSLAKLNGADVYLFFIESYGYTVFADSRHYPLIVPFLKAADRKLKARGFVTCSNYLNSPTYGGTSWLAHGSLASGIYLNNQMEYNLLLTSEVRPIADYFSRAGYRTVSVMPGTLWPWPSGDFYKYQKKYYARHFDYNGPNFGWAPMPDQYVLDYIHRMEIRNHTRPLFIEFALVSSHAPFHEQPTYIANWSEIRDGSIYHTQKPVMFPIVWPDLRDASQAYITSIRYDLEVLVGYLENFVSGDEIIIIMGDHQPNVQITGENQPWSVPVHIISRNHEFIRPFIKRGYTPGLIPDQTLPHQGMETFLWALLEDFSQIP